MNKNTTDLPLSGHVAVTSRNTKEERVIGSQDIGSDNGVGSFGRGVHLRQNFVGKGFLHSVQDRALMIRKEDTGNVTYW